jgi:hypothetical protein
MAGASHRPPELASGGELPLSIVITVGFVSVCFIGAVTLLIVMDKPVDNLMLIVGAYLAPTITTLLSTRRTNAKLDRVETKVNGTVSNLVTDKALLEDQVRELGDKPITLPARRANDPHPITVPKGFSAQSRKPDPAPPTEEIPRHG